MSNLYHRKDKPPKCLNSEETALGLLLLRVLHYQDKWQYHFALQDCIGCWLEIFSGHVHFSCHMQYHSQDSC
jgi:hypothetical protein